MVMVRMMIGSMLCWIELMCNFCLVSGNSFSVVIVLGRMFSGFCSSMILFGCSCVCVSCLVM